MSEACVPSDRSHVDCRLIHAIRRLTARESVTSVTQLQHWVTTRIPLLFYLDLIHEVLRLTPQDGGEQRLQLLELLGRKCLGIGRHGV
jgi:hypothetical protein